MGCTTGEFTVTLPNPIDVAFKLIAALAAFNCSATARDELPVLAVSVTVCALLTQVALAVNVALDAVAGIVIEEGTVTAPLLLARLTV